MCVNGSPVVGTPPNVGSRDTAHASSCLHGDSAGLRCSKEKTQGRVRSFTWSTFTFRAEKKTPGCRFLLRHIPLQRSKACSCSIPPRPRRFFPTEHDGLPEWEPTCRSKRRTGAAMVCESDNGWQFGKNRGQAIQAAATTRKGPVLRLNVIRDSGRQPAEYSLSFSLMGFAPCVPRPRHIGPEWGRRTRRPHGRSTSASRPMVLD